MMIYKHLVIIENQCQKSDMMIDDDNDIHIKRRSSVNKSGIFVGILIVLIAFAWIAAKMGWIPSIVFDLWPQIILIIIGIFVVYKSLVK